MSKLIDRLEKVGQSSPIPFGFSAKSRREEPVPEIVVIGRAKSQDLAKSPGLAEASVDAILVSGDSWEGRAFKRITDSLQGRVWGVAVIGIDQDQAGKLQTKGCDFLVFSAQNTAAGVLNDDEPGKLLAVGPGLDEDLARAIQELPIDGALYSPKEPLLPLTVQKLIDVQIVRGLMDKPLVVEAPPDMGRTELQAFRDAGIVGLVVDLSSTDAITRMNEAIADLPRRKTRPASRDAIVPHPFSGLGTHVHDDEEQDDDEGDF